MSWLNKYSIIFFDVLDSTDLEAKRMIKRGVRGNHVIVSAVQTRGKGRNGNFWHSPDGNLYFSIVFDHKNNLSNLSQLSLVTSLSCHEAMQYFLNDKELSLFPKLFKIKWPNDLLLNDKKFCGILLQTLPCMDVHEDKIINYLIIGVGMNLTNSPKNINYLTTSLKEEGIEHKYNDVFNKIMERFNENYKLWQAEGFSDIRSRWIQNTYNVGKKVFFDMKGKKNSGLFKDIDEDGQMVIELESGVLHKVTSCDVQVV
jgi:BirA family transcriptional regulator, biotin operon repressor / biotin---[acetyl-CoA-carboxylase] ligase